MKTRREFLLDLMAGAAGLTLLPLAARAQAGTAIDAWTTVYPQILGRIKAPRFAKRDFPITKFGAKAGVENDSTAAIAKAIAACSNAGGGRVVVPAGVFLTGAVHLRSNVNLHLAK